jgi:hypothetical protein
MQEEDVMRALISRCFVRDALSGVAVILVTARPMPAKRAVISLVALHGNIELIVERTIQSNIFSRAASQMAMTAWFLIFLSTEMA